MITLLLAIFLAGLMILSIALLKAFRHIPKKELKRRARSGDETARALYRVTAYGMDLDILLWLLIGLSSGVFLALLAYTLPWPLVVFGCVSVIWFGFAWLPNTRVSTYNLRLAQFISPAIHFVLENLNPVFSGISRLVHRVTPVHVHSGLFTKEDILDIITQQKTQVDNRITQEELYIAAHALTFGDKIVAQTMTPKRMIKMVSASDIVGPLLMDELHGSGHSRFPVYQDTEDTIVGTLFIRDLLGIKQGGLVRSVMSPDVYYVHENEPLTRVLDAFLKTKHQMFIVVNEFEEITGLITIEDIIEQVIGKHIIDEFDQYDDLRAVANIQAKTDKQNHTHP